MPWAIAAGLFQRYDASAFSTDEARVNVAEAAPPLALTLRACARWRHASDLAAGPVRQSQPAMIQRSSVRNELGFDEKMPAPSRFR